MKSRGFVGLRGPGEWAYCFVAAPSSVTRMMRLVLLWWIKRLPSRVGRMADDAGMGAARSAG